MGECFFWYRPTRVVTDQRPLNGCVCVCVCVSFQYDEHSNTLDPQPTSTVLSGTLTACDASGRTSLFCGSWSRVTIHRWVSTCCRLMRWWGSMCSMRDTRSLAADDTTSQLPPLSANLPSPMRTRICSAESSGPLANGV